MKYNYNQIRDFLNDDSFVQWVLTNEHESFWKHFLEENPTKNAMIEEARQLVLEINEAEDQQSPKLNEGLVWSKIHSTLQEPKNEEQTPVRKLWQQPVWRWAASIVVLIGIGWVVWQNQSKETVTYQELIATIEDKNTLIEKTNESDTPLNVALEDGSVVTLDKNSKLSYPAHFDKNKRTVILSGEAFFEIAKDPSKPFYVYANEVVTKVLGTSFRIRAFEKDKQVVVKVRTGRVSVYNQRRINLTDPETNGIVLLPNQQAVYSRGTENLTRRLVETPMPVAEHTSMALPTRFDEVAVSEVLKAIEKRYGVKVLFNEEVLANCFITTTLGEESLYEKLDLICKIIGATYKEVDAQIVLESKGCQ